ncbi:tRNA1(Val) (adenine(37)-N6)-methyltransferase [Rheinheimera sediminis]|uniref:tRNA1(Val) (adenine(37)-N6)-methyltransferase n=1 Tax=Rheinheimera sp. YQF-1 TaxID=2499626 RepID=UPI0021BD4469|nr:methyltransferase [Rheinheimera sp. YQF-1]
MSGFRCKEFFVGHDRCAMKVGTDAFLLGAWATLPKAGTALDIGAGSGILSLMLAQRMQKSGLNPLVYAVELDQDAALQAQDNVAASRWAAQIHVIQADILTYAATDNQPEHGFELIISNPPYFQQSLAASDPKRHQARHTDSLAFTDLAFVAKKLATADAHFCLVLPAEADFISVAEQAGWALQRRCLVRTTADKKAKLQLLEFSTSAVSCQVEQTELLIQQSPGHYSEAYQTLLADFYLRF